MKIVTALVLVGLGLIAYSLSLYPYKGQRLFMPRYMGMSSGQSKEYWKLRDEMLTSKYMVQDYGGTSLVAGIGLLLLTRLGFRAPKSRGALVALALAAPFISGGAYVFDIQQGADRGEFPPWADSVAIPLVAAPVEVALLLIWSLAHLAFLRSAFSTSAPLALAISRRANPWLLFVSAATTSMIVWSAVEGAYWYVIACLLWLYFFLSLAAGRRAAYDAQQGATVGISAP
jgi:hypothetical protein